MKKKINEEDLKDIIQSLAETIASGNWGAWECSLGALVALVELTNKLKLDDYFCRELIDIKEKYSHRVKSIVNSDPKDFFNR